MGPWYGTSHERMNVSSFIPATVVGFRSPFVKDPVFMSSTITRPAPSGAEAREAMASRRRTRIFALPEARWAAVALVLFLVTLPLYLTGAPVWSWGALFAAVYATGGWEPGWAGLQALREKTLDVDLLMVVAAL